MVDLLRGIAWCCLRCEPGSPEEEHLFEALSAACERLGLDSFQVLSSVRDVKPLWDGDPDIAAAVADLATFPDIQAGPGIRDLDPAEIDAAWVALRARLDELKH